MPSPARTAPFTTLRHHELSHSCTAPSHRQLAHLMVDTDSSGNYFFALEILSAAAVASADADQAKIQTPIYADESILICSLPETPCSSASPISQIEETLDPPGCNNSRSLALRKHRSSVSRRRSKCAKIKHFDSDEEKLDDLVGEEHPDDLQHKSVNPSFASETPGGAGDRKYGDGPNESMAPTEQELFSLLDFVKRKPNKRFEDTDILEIAAMKKIYFPPPRWCKPGGYGA